MIAAAILLDAVVIVRLAGGLLAAAIFVVFVAGFLLPACALVLRLPHIRTMPPDLRTTTAGVIVVILSVPWFFVRKVLPFSPAIADVVMCVLLTGAAVAFASVPATLEELGPSLKRSRFLVLFALPVLFALAWLGYAARSGDGILFHGLFSIDFGNLVSVVATLRASPLLPLSVIVDGGPLSYHWFYFTLPATLAGFFGAAIPASNALILVNLLMASLLVHTLVTAVSMFCQETHRRTTQLAVAVTLFAPFTVYYYQVAAEHLSLGWLAMPWRNHLMLSPVNSMIVFGNNTFALVLVLFTVMELERWNRERRIVDVVMGTTALSMVIGYSATLLFPMVGALLVWLTLGRIAKPLYALAWAVVMGSAAVAMFLAIRVVVPGGDPRHIAFAFDDGQFLRMAILGMLPLWALAVFGGRKPLAFFHMVIVAAIGVPSFLYVAGNPSGHIDFSMKTGSLLAVAFAPLIAVTIERWRTVGLPRWQTIAAAFLVALGTIQTSAYILRFPYDRMTGARSASLAFSIDYYRTLVWLRVHTPRQSIVVDPGGLSISVALPCIWIAERRAWLPTRYVEPYLAPVPGSSLPRRAALWAAFMRDPGNSGVSRAIASEADYLIVPREVHSPFWTAVTSCGSWMIYRSTVPHAATAS